MKRKQKVAIAIAMLSALSLSAGVFAACKDKGKDPPEYGFGDPPQGGSETAQPDAGFKIDGVFDEAEYANQRWLHGVKVEKDSDNLVYSNAVSDIEGAAKFSMTAVFGTSGIYVATKYTAAEGELLYVNPDRTSYMNSITELYFAAPQFTSMDDVGVCEIDMEPTGELTFKRKSTDGKFNDFTKPNDIMAQLGVTCNGEVGEDVAEGERATEYTCELFIPWDYVDEIAGEGTADVIKNNGEIRLNAAPITSNDYFGTDTNLNRWWWMMGSQLDNGSWGNVDGWYHFNKNGLVSYDIDIKESDGGKVMERFGYDFAVAKNSVTFLIEADEGKTVSDVKVNDESYAKEITYPNNNLRYAYVTVPANKVKGDLTVEAEYVSVPTTPQPFEATVRKISFGKTSALAGATKVKLTGPTTDEFDVEDNKISGSLLPGLYKAELVGAEFEDYREITDIVYLGGNFELTFSVSAFTQSKFGDKTNEESFVIDDTHANDVDGYITNVKGNSFFPTTNETFGDSVFTANFKKSQQGDNNAFMLRYIFDEAVGGKYYAVQVALKIIDGKLSIQWYVGNEWGVNTIEKDDANLYVWEPYLTLPQSFLDEFLDGDGVDLTMVRRGDAFHVFASINGGETVEYFRSYTVSNAKDYYSATGYWAISILNSVAGARVNFSLDDSSNTVEEWTTFSVDVTVNGEGTASSTHEEATVGETIEITLTPNSDDYYVSSVTINGKFYPLIGDTLKLTRSDGKEIEVVVTFAEKQPISFTVNVETSLKRLGKTVDLEGEEVLLSGSGYSGDGVAITDGKITVAEILPGWYKATLNAYTGAIDEIEIMISAEGDCYDAEGNKLDKLAFTYNAFTQSKFGDKATDSYVIDDTHANDENYIINKKGSSFFPTMNEAVGDSVFTATFKQGQQTSDHSFLIRYIFEDTANTTKLAVQACLKILNGNLIIQWYLGSDWNVKSIPEDKGQNYVWEPYMTLPQAFLTEFTSGDGVDLTMVRDGDTFYVFASINGGETVTFFRSYTVADTYDDTGYWAISIMNSKADAVVPFKFDDSENATDAWTSFKVDVEKTGTGTGTVKIDNEEITTKTVAVGGTITLSVEPDEDVNVTVTVNGVECQLDDGKLELTAQDGLDIHVVVTFKAVEPVAFTVNVAKLQRLGKSVSLSDYEVILSSGTKNTTFDITGSESAGYKVTGSILPGTYTAKLNAFEGAVADLSITIADDGTVTTANNQLTFVYDAFKQAVDASTAAVKNNTKLDTSHANDENGYIINDASATTGDSFFPVSNEAFGDSVFTVNLKYSQATRNNSMMLRYIFEGKNKALQIAVKYNNNSSNKTGDFIMQWMIGDQWGVGINDSTLGWTPVDAMPREFYDAYDSSTGVNVTMAHDGDWFHMFISIPNTDKVYYCRSYEVTDSNYMGQKGHWAISILDSAKGAIVPFTIEEDDAAISAWVAKKEAWATPQSVTIDVSVMRFGVKDTSKSLEGATVTLSGTQTYSDLTVADGKITATLLPDKYTASISGAGEEYASMDVAFYGSNVPFSLGFGKTAFTQAKFGSANATIDASHANDEKGYIVNSGTGVAFFPTTEESFGNSAFTVNFNKRQQTTAHSFIIRYIFESEAAAKSAIQATIKINGSDLIFQWYLGGDWGVSSIPADGTNYGWNPMDTLPQAFLDEFNTGDGVDLTVVRDGLDFHVFASINHGATVMHLRSYKVNSSYTDTKGYWAISIMNCATNAAAYFKLEDTQNAVDAWVAKKSQS